MKSKVKAKPKAKPKSKIKPKAKAKSKPKAKKKEIKKVVEEVPKDPRIERIWWEDVTYTCPARGVVTEKVKIIRYKPQSVPESTPVDLEILKDLDTSEDTE